MLKAAFVRVVGERDRIYVTRSDGSEVSWAFATYGDGLPHDLVHLVVESAFGLRRGFWGRVDEGADPGRISNDANRKGGANKYAAYDADQSELLAAEALAAVLSRADASVLGVRKACAELGTEVPPTLSEARVSEARARLAELQTRWRALPPKGALELTFDRGQPASAGRG